MEKMTSSLTSRAVSSTYPSVCNNQSEKVKVMQCFKLFYVRIFVNILRHLWEEISKYHKSSSSSPSTRKQDLNSSIWGWTHPPYPRTMASDLEALILIPLLAVNCSWASMSTSPDEALSYEEHLWQRAQGLGLFVTELFQLFYMDWIGCSIEQYSKRWSYMSQLQDLTAEYTSTLHCTTH